MVRRPSPLLRFLGDFAFELVVALALGLIIASL